MSSFVWRKIRVKVGYHHSTSHEMRVRGDRDGAPICTVVDADGGAYWTGSVDAHGRRFISVGAQDVREGLTVADAKTRAEAWAADALAAAAPRGDRCSAGVRLECRRRDAMPGM